MPRGGVKSGSGGTKSGKVRSGESLGRGGTHARHTPPANMIYSDAAFIIISDEKPRGGGIVFALDPSSLQVSSTKIPSIQSRILKWS